ncbi:outer membrane protein assembly factor BamB [Polynucleobacter kasalickyi]|uniref:Outer membrane protein assembly factor BamB n=1 Tax=Polynucleobacter kasalickyi TaxID=1938817 RepID=A0A1W2B158_9BURK|nr:outer membrane protein assembly factor BamB [Polynucleobacter kasalickyi]SMC66669.1 Beta-barrel assembly machine subunit BamB [Polynucleobacter kasalickyi]
MKFLKSFSCVLSLLLITVALSSCSGSKRRLAAELTPIANPINLQKVWSVSIGKSQPYNFKPVLVGNAIYTAATAGEVYKFNSQNGQSLWQVNVKETLSAGPGSDGKIVVIPSIKGTIYAFDAMTGKPLWDTSVATEVLTEPLVVAGMVVIRTVDNRFIALDASTGKRKWVNQRGQSTLSLRASYSMGSINNEVIFTGFSGGKFGLLALSNGNLIWESLLAPPKGASEIERLSDVAAKPTLLGSRMCAVSYQGKIGCGEIKNAAMSWTKDFSSYSGTTQSADAVFAVNDKSYLTGFNALNGQELWRNEKLVWRDLGEPLAVGKVILAGDAEGYLHLFGQDNGNILGRVRVDSTPIEAPPVPTNGLIIVQSKGGTLAAYRIQ